MLPPKLDLITVYGVPAHPLMVHAVVVLLPLAALGGFVIALRASWRRRLGLAVLAVAAAGIGAVPLAKTTGEQLEAALRAALPPGVSLGPAIEQHGALGENLLPFALAFGVALVLLLIAGRLADRERDAAQSAQSSGADSTVTTTWRRVAVVAAALVAFTGVAATVQVVRIGHSGAAAVWQGVGGS